MKTFYRGTTVDFETTFINAAGTALTVDSATITITYPLDGYPLNNGTFSATYDMVDEGDNLWSYAWASADSGPGYVYWHMKASSLDAATEDGQFLILSNPASRFLHGPSSSSSNDYGGIWD